MWLGKQPAICEQIPGWGGGRVLSGQRGTDTWTKDCETYPKQCAQNIKTGTLFTVFPTKGFSFHYVLSLYFTPNHSVFFFFFFYQSWKNLPLFQPKKCFFSDPKRRQRCALASLRKKYPFSSFFVQASVPSRLASAPPPPRPPPVSPSMTYAHRIPPACRVMPTFFFYFILCSH